MKTIHHVVDVDCAQDVLWAALTERDKLAGWWSTGLDAPPMAVGSQAHWTFAGDFNPIMQTLFVDPPHEVVWRCVAGHQPWQDSVFRFQVAAADGGRTRLRFWQEYAVELADDYYGVYNLNWGYYLESLRLLCAEGVGKPFHPSGAR